MALCYNSQKLSVKLVIFADETPYGCSKCNKKFKTKKNLSRHFSNHHKEGKPKTSKTKKSYFIFHDWDTCTSSKCSTHINLHMDLLFRRARYVKERTYKVFSHCRIPEVQTFTCVMCNGKFNSKYGLHTHERSVHGLKPSTVCDFPDCGYTAPTPSELKKHQVKHMYVLFIFTLQKI